MGQGAIFDGVVRNEDAYTNLLRNLMITDRDFGESLLSAFLPGSFHHLAEQPFDVHTQVRLLDADIDHGRADMVVTTGSLLLLVEVKVSAYCQMTVNQELESLSDRGYLRYLRNQKSAFKHVSLAFLTPRSWTHAASVRASLKQHGDWVIPCFLHWEDICCIAGSARFSLWVREFGKFLQRELMSISSTEADRQ